MPYSFDCAVPDQEGELKRVTLVGVFALFAGPDYEAAGSIGAAIHLLSGLDSVFRLNLLNRRHYSDAFDLKPVRSFGGDETTLRTVGVTLIDGREARVDALTIEIPDGTKAKSFHFKDLGGPSSFIVYDLLFEFEKVVGCPFSSRSGGISLGDLPSIVRVGDRVRFNRAIDQLADSIESAEDLDEARGLALTFLAIVTASTLEMGGSREMHFVQLEAARELERLRTRGEIGELIREKIERVAGSLFGPKASPSARLVDRALAIVERNFAKNLSDTTVAAQLGLSTSHFRFLFRQATGQPFHKYLIAVRLEKARRLLIEQDVPVSHVAMAVGFAGLSHFSRAFTQRFSVSPTHIRRHAGDPVHR